MLLVYKAGASNLLPAGQTRPVKYFNPAREIKQDLICLFNHNTM
jgi:hypothetical protein